VCFELFFEKMIAGMSVPAINQQPEKADSDSKCYHNIAIFFWLVNKNNDII
jgi:hypothetical protein